MLRPAIYDRAMMSILEKELRRDGLAVSRGILCGFSGPAYETAAEIQMIRRLGAHCACMSTVLEAAMGHALGLQVAALSLVTNWGTGVGGARPDHDEVVAMAARAGPVLSAPLTRAIRSFGARVASH